ncbi:MAG TPA: His/Gly/Thr/Pro-type tRNA ligase C-terminal domain-containing protein, partial [Baekduia sp.]|nr:His/Gly/Thr/Pro-type tRNA ligase C-terminal domain-containing protein [Baekduia sp.]
AAGVGRAILAFLCDAYDEEVLEGGDVRTVLRLHPRLAPVKAAILPLVKKDGQPELAREVQAKLSALMQTEYDAGGAGGKRYRRQDEIGTPGGITVDHQSVEDRTVTVRDRDTLEQERVAIDELPGALAGRLAAPWVSPKV